MRTELQTNQKRRLIVPVLCGALSAYVMMQPSFNPSEGSLLQWFQIGSIFFGASTLLSCAFLPRHPFYVAIFILVGVCAGTLIDVAVHPMTHEGFERNIFPIEVMFLVAFAMPSVLAVSMLWQVVTRAVSGWQKRG